MLRGFGRRFSPNSLRFLAEQALAFGCERASENGYAKRADSRREVALQLSGETSARGIEVRFRNRKLGRIARYTEDALRETLAKATKHYRRPPNVEEFE
jgi:hypothetical protein